MREQDNRVEGVELGSFEAEKLDGFEAELMQAMRRIDAPEGFAERVMVRTAAPAVPAKVLRMRARFAALQSRAWIGGAIAAVLTLGVFVGGGLHVRHEREQAAVADQQFATAVRATDHALDQTREQLERAGVNLGN